MPAQLYPLARNAFLNGDLDWLVDDFKVLLLDKGRYAVNFGTDEFQSIIPAPAMIAISPSLTGKTSTAGVADADDALTEPLGGEELVTALVVFHDSGNPATSRLVAYTDSGIGFPLIQSGGPVLIRWSDGPTRIFVL